MTRTASIPLLASTSLVLAACGPAEPSSAPARDEAPAPAAGPSCDYLVEFVDSASLKPVAPPIRLKEAATAASGVHTCPQLPRGWSPAPSPLGGGAEPAPGSEAAARLAQVRGEGKKVTLTVSLLVR